MTKTEDGKQILNIVVEDDIPALDIRVISEMAMEHEEVFWMSSLSSLVEDATRLTTEKGYFVMVHGGQKTFEAICIHNNIRDTQWMPHSGC